MGQVMSANPLRIEYETDPAKNAEARVQMEQFRSNLKWMESHAAEVFRHRGKIICIAGQELFVADTVEDVLARAKAANPNDGGMFTQIIPKERGARICAC
jgi:hypothetical protein